MKQDDIKIGSVYVGRCGKRFRWVERFDIFGRMNVRCAKRYGDGVLRVDAARPDVRLMPDSMAKWAAREATADEAAAVLALVSRGGR